MSQKRRFTFDSHPIYLLGESGTEKYGAMKVQDFYTLQQQCLESGKLFEDPEFPATDASLFYSHTSDPTRPYEWLRPMEICKNPQFFEKGYSRFDVRQGDLYDCWFLAAAANLTLNQKLFTRVVCADNTFDEKYCGIFHFCFWRFGKWIDVVVDDRLPTYKGRLIYNRSIDNNEFWSALLEKAYAKIHGCYETLIGGNTSEALEDFTGGITERYNLKEVPKNLFNILMKGFERNSMMGCSIESEIRGEMETKEGLVKGHAYSITKAQYVDIVTTHTSGKIPLLRLRNPWGDEFEWKGPWSDTSHEWSLIPEATKKEIGLTFDNDGEFWMSYRDFLKYFNNLEICNLTPDSLTDEITEVKDKKWTLNTFEGEWIPKISAGGCNDRDKYHKNPQYILQLEDADKDSEDGKCSVVIALMQKNRRNKKRIGLELLTIGFKIFKLSEEDLDEKPLKTNFFKYNASVDRSTFINLREVSSRFKLQPGYYLIVPSTFDPDEEGEFLLRVFSETKNSIAENDEAVRMGDVDSRISTNDFNISFPASKMLALEKIFLDVAGPEKEIGWSILQRILDNTLSDATNTAETLAKNEENTLNQKFDQNHELAPSKRSFWETILQFIMCGDNKQEVNNNLEKSSKIIEKTVNDDQARSENQRFSKDVCRSMVAMLDFDRSGKLGLDEFKVLLEEIAKWKAVFKLYDRDQNNKLDTSELREALASAGYRLNNHVLGSLLYRYGSPDNTMTLDDFIMCAVKVKTMIDRFKGKDVNKINRASFTLDEWITLVLYS